MSKMRTFLWHVFIMAVVLCMPAGLWPAPLKNPQAAGSDNKRVTLAVEYCVHAACAHVAREKGWFREAGIDIRSFDNYVTGMALAAALSRGDVDAAYICLIPAICAYANGGVQLKVVSGTHKYGYALAVNPVKIIKPEDLANPGIRLGCSRAGSPGDVLLQKIIARHSLHSDAVISNVRRMNPPQQLMALKMGHLDAALMPEQYPNMAVGYGFTVMHTARELWPGMQGSVLVVTEKFAAEYPDMVKNLVAVTKRATKWICANPGPAAQIVSSSLQVTGNRIFPSKAAATAEKLHVSPEAILTSLTESMICTTDIDPLQVQQTIDYLHELGYIRTRFDAARILSPGRGIP